MFHGRELQPKSKISAKDYNEIRRRVMNMDESRMTAESHHTPNPVIVRIRNMTEDILPEFSIVGIKTPMYYKESKEDFNNQGTAYGVELEARPWDSDANDHEAQDFGVITRRLAPNSLGYAVIAGPSPVQITHYVKDYPYALPQHNNTETMRAMPFGPAKIIWIDTNDESDSGSSSDSSSEEKCDPKPRNAYIDIQNQQWWQFFELQEPLEACSSADAIACYHCGGQIGPCKIHRRIWLPRLGCEDDGNKLPLGTIVLAHWFEQENKWIAINWREDCPDFDEFTPDEQDLVKIGVPVRFEYNVDGDPCEGVGGGAGGAGAGNGAGTLQSGDPGYIGGGEDSDGNGGDEAINNGGVGGAFNNSCSLELVYNETRFYKNDCGLFCVYDTEEKRIPVFFPSYRSYIPVGCTINDQPGGSDDSDSSSELDYSDSDSCTCDGGRWIHMVYPEVQINCGKICFTGNTIVAPGCDISLTQDTRLTLYDNQFIFTEGSPCDSDSGSSSDSDVCPGCSTLTITRRKKDAHIVCDEWCEGKWTDVGEVKIPVVASDGGEITYVDNIHLTSGECGCLSMVIDYATTKIHCGAICSPTITPSQPIPVCLNGETKDVEVITGVTGTIDISGASKTVIQDVALDLSNLELVGTSESVVTGVSFDATKLSLAGGTAQTVISDVTYTAPTLASTSVSIPTVSGATLDASKLTLTGQDVNVLTGASITPVTGSLSYGADKTVLSDVTLDNTKLTVSVPLTLVTGGSVSGSLTISIPMVKKTVVTDVSVDGCEITGTKEDVYCLNPSSPTAGQQTLDINVSVTGLTFTPTTSTATYSGTVRGGRGYMTKTTTTVSQANGVNITGGVLTVSDTTILAATGISAQSGAVNLTAGTAVSAVGSVSLTNGSVSKSTASITIPTGVASSQTPLSTTTATVISATGLSGQGGITKTTTTVTDAGSAAFTATTTKQTLSFVNGVLCEEDSSSGSNNV